MNTDNMFISGETLDYGPCAFMDEYDAMTKEEQQKLIADMLTPNDVDSDNDIEVDEEKEMND